MTQIRSHTLSSTPSLFYWSKRNSQVGLFGMVEIILAKPRSCGKARLWAKHGMIPSHSEFETLDAFTGVISMSTYVIHVHVERTLFRTPAAIARAIIVTSEDKVSYSIA